MKNCIFILALITTFVLIATDTSAVVEKLDKALYELEVGSGVSDREFSEVEQQYDRLILKYTEPDEQGRIYASKLRRYCRNGPQVPIIIMEYSVKALEFPLEPDIEMDVRLKLGDATWRHGSEELNTSLVEVRREAAVVYLQGIRVAVEQGIPYGALPDLPPGITVRGSGADYERLREEAERRSAARKDRKALEKLIAGRGELEKSLLYLYALKPRDHSELRLLCEQHLIDEVAVSMTMKRLEIAIAELEGRAIEGESVLHPKMPREMREKFKYIDEDQYLERAKL